MEPQHTLLGPKHTLLEPKHTLIESKHTQHTATQHTQHTQHQQHIGSTQLLVYFKKRLAIHQMAKRVLGQGREVFAPVRITLVRTVPCASL
jgi:hypothetical protein